MPKVLTSIDLLQPKSIEDINLAGVEAAIRLPIIANRKVKTEAQREKKYRDIEDQVSELLQVDVKTISNLTGNVMGALKPIINKSIEMISQTYVDILIQNKFRTKVRFEKKLLKFVPVEDLKWSIGEIIQDDHVKKILTYDKDRAKELMHVTSVLGYLLKHHKDRRMVHIKSEQRWKPNYDLFKQRKEELKSLGAKEGMELYCFFLSTIDGYLVEMKQSLIKKALQALQGSLTTKTMDTKPILKTSSVKETLKWQSGSESDR